MSKIDLYKGDCLEVMDELIAKGVVVDAIITDPPYGTTACKWDSIIPFDEMWLRLNKLIKPNGAIVLFGSEPFSSALRMSNIKNYKYDWIWNKKRITAPFLAKKQPLRQHELISLFYNKQCTYNYQPTRKNTSKSFSKKEMESGKVEVYGDMKRKGARNENEYGYPKTILNCIPVMTNMSKEKFLHPTTKPVALMEYLVKTYTNEDELVLDFTMGSGTTGVACKNLNRNFIGIEMDSSYYDIAVDRINNIQKGLF